MTFTPPKPRGSSLVSTTTIPPRPRKPRPWKPKGPFRFFDLPSELRNRIYEFALLVPRTIDLDPSNHKRIAPRLDLLQTSKRIYEEAYPIFYGQHTFRIFPTHAGFLNAKQPLIMGIPRHYRRALTTLEIRFGPGWGKPPKCQTLRPKLGLKDCTSVRELKVFVEIDPSHEVFTGYRISESFYTNFASGMLEGVLQQIPSIAVVEFDAAPSVRMKDPLMTALLRTVREATRSISWGPEKGWGREENDVACDGRVFEETIAAIASIRI